MITLQTDRLHIRHYIPGDLGALHSLLSDEKAMYYLDDLATTTVEESAENLAYIIRNADGRYFCIRHAETNVFFGSVGYTYTTQTPLGSVAHLGYFLLPLHHGNGYATEAARRVIEYAFTDDSCIRVTTACYAENAASRRVMEKAGFRKEGEHIQAQFHDGVMKDRLSYAINKSEWPPYKA